MVKVLFLGSNSIIAKTLCRDCISFQYEYAGRNYRNMFDLAEPSTLIPLLKKDKFTHCVILSSLTSIQYCQNNIQQASQLNYYNTVIVLDILKSFNVCPIFISSSAVFPSEKKYPSFDDVKDSATVYGDLKLRVEDYMIKHSFGIVLRLTKYLPSLTSLIQKWKILLDSNSEIICFSDKYFSPVSKFQFSYALDTIVFNHSKYEHRCYIYHVTGSHDLSYFELGTKLALSMNKHVDTVIPEFVTLDKKRNYDSLGVRRGIDFVANSDKIVDQFIYNCIVRLG